MAKTILQVHHGGVHFWLNTESSSPNTGHRNRYRLFETENYGRDKSGWIQVGSIAGQDLIATRGEKSLFEACEKLFASKKPPPIRTPRSNTRQARKVGGRGIPYSPEPTETEIGQRADCRVSAAELDQLIEAANKVSVTDSRAPALTILKRRQA